MNTKRATNHQSSSRPTGNIATFVVAALFVVLLGANTAEAQVRVNIGINLGVFPELVVVPGYPVYYAPSVRANYFFHDGLYWVFNVDDGYWYSSSWYNGPWVYVEPVYVPQFILVVPFNYYRVRPVYWSGWAFDAPPRWGVHWGNAWEVRRHGWERWDRTRVYVAAPLPVYQKNYPRGRYPSAAQQVVIHNEHYHFKSQDVHIQQQQTRILHQQSQGGARASGKAEGVQHQEKAQRQEKSQRQENVQRSDKGQRQEFQRPGQQRQETPQYQDKGQRQDKSQHQEKGQKQEKGPRQEKGQHEEKGPR